MDPRAYEKRVDGTHVTELRTGGNVVRRRMLAFVVDTVVVSGAVFTFAGRLVRSRIPRIALTAIGSAVAGLFYHVLLEGTYGQTVGKRLLGIAVVQTSGQSCTYTAAVIRTLLRFVDWLPVGYLVGFAAMGLTERHQRVGDLLARTVVVRSSHREHGNRD